MRPYLLLAIALLISTNIFSQRTNLSDYSYVVVPQQYDFLKGNDEYKLNTMTKFYFEKYGFNAYMANAAPNANRCDGLYANVEELKTLFGTKLQIVLKDCDANEIYRSQVGKSKYKEYDKTYQDALRKAFNSIEALRVEQKNIALQNPSKTTTRYTVTTKVDTPVKIDPSAISEDNLPSAKFSNYSNSGKTFLLRKTTEGYSLYEESPAAEDGLLLKGKIILMEKVVKYMDTAGKVSDASFDAAGNLTINDGSTATVYFFQN
ncbi:hypothetical protein [Aequorivita marisscotiae]|uniref:GLPGLI family protein n=1 Tax=Aequorivita marisscotiae TaxID=3040348 RepID=A0ABY8KWB9_9FLAO|nr:hypothetical protein [Aequorivita sp. Ant34-E75]WGF92829.1 hypothetical protein QCQ61_01235 [Aequorivita sp. Ant34-E75]